ncbi:MAG: serine/threonine-protein kinase [Thermoleophilaceae bacterium]
MTAGEGRAPAGAALRPGSRLAGYRIERVLGRGGMGSVYEASQVSLERRVALKVISPELGADESFRERFRREARIAATVEHPNLLPVYEAGETRDGRLYISMRYVDGDDLESRLRRLGPLGAAEALAIFGQVAGALDAAHAAGLIHRDVKPANVLLEERRGAAYAYLADFGLAKELAGPPAGAKTRSLLGTVDYMAPEQVAGEGYGAGVDIYAFGGMVYRALTGSVPYRRDTSAATLVAHREAPVPRPTQRAPELPSAFDDLVARAMAKDPSSRAASAGELIHRVTRELEYAGMPVEGAEAPTVVDATGQASEPLRDGRSLILRTAMYIAVYAPIWVAAYLIGRYLL